MRGTRRARHRRARADRAAQPRPPRCHRRRPGRGDGAGILTQMPDAFLRESAGLRPARRAARYAVGTGLPARPTPTARADAVERGSRRIAAEEGLQVLGWRDVPVRRRPGRRRPPATACRTSASCSSPPATARRSAASALDRLAFCLRKRAERELEVYFASLSARTLVYKGMLTTGQLEPFFPDLSDRPFETELALVHSRFSTNTFPSWPLAHPYRLIAHNGEINTVKGNRNWMRARESQLASDLIPGDLQRLFPICTPGGQRLGVLRRGARAAAPGRPVAAARRADDDPRGVGEPRRDGPRPAGVLRVPRDVHGALGRPGLRRLHRRHADRRRARPQRPAARPLLGHRRRAGRAGQRGRACSTSTRPAVVRKGRLQPGRMFLVDTEHGRLVGDDEIKAELAAEHPYDEWLHAGLIHLDDLPEREHIVHTPLVGHPAPADLRLHRGGAAAAARADGPHRRRADRLDGHRHPGRRAVRPAAAALRLLHPAVRPGDQPAAGRDPRGARDLARLDHRAGAERPGGDAGALPPAGAARPGHRQRRAGQDRPRQRRRRPAGLRDRRRQGPVRRHRRRSGPAGPAGRDLRRGVRRRSRPAPGSSSCPTATRAATWRRSRRCC